MELSDIGLHPSDPLAGPVVSIRSQWNKVCHTYSIDGDAARTFLISYFGLIYDGLLQQCQAAIKPPITSATPTPTEDMDDVYYRFGGAAIAAMLKLTYDKIRSSSCADKNRVSLEITILQKLSVHLEEAKATFQNISSTEIKDLCIFQYQRCCCCLKQLMSRQRSLQTMRASLNLDQTCLKKLQIL